MQIHSIKKSFLLYIFSELYASLYLFLSHFPPSFSLSLSFSIFSSLSLSVCLPVSVYMPFLTHALNSYGFKNLIEIQTHCHTEMIMSYYMRRNTYLYACMYVCMYARIVLWNREVKSLRSIIFKNLSFIFVSSILVYIS